MKKIFPLLFLFTLLLSSCNLPRQGTITGTPTVKMAAVTPSPTIQPSPTPTPTPLPAVRIQQGDESLLNGDYQPALEQYQAALNSTQDDLTQAASLLGMGRAYTAAGNWIAAVPPLEKVVTEFGQTPSAAPASYLLAECHIANGNYNQAAAMYEKYIKLRPGVLDAMMYEKRGLALEAGGDYSNAISAYQAAIDASPNSDTADLQTRIGKNYIALNDYQNAIRTFIALYDATNNDYIKARANLFAGQAYMALGLSDQAFARYQDSVNNYPRAFDSYTALVELVNAGQPVDELNRGLVDYFAGMYGPAIEAFNRYLEAGGVDGGTALYYLAQCQRANGYYNAAIDDWEALIQNYPDHRFYAAAWEDVADTQWYYLNDYTAGSKMLLDFVALHSGATEAPDYLYQAGRILERGGYLTQAADVWARIIDEYPSSEDAYPGLFLSGLTYYRLGNYDQSLLTFQRLLVLAGDVEDQARAWLWIGKNKSIRGDLAGAQAAWQEAARVDPTGYYGERSFELLDGKEPFQGVADYNLTYDLEAERFQAETWMYATFAISREISLTGLADLASNPYYIKASALWELGLYVSARSEFENLRLEVKDDPISTYRLMNDFLERGINRSAILACHRILTLAGKDDEISLTVPRYFNHIRYGVYYPNIILPAAQAEGLDPLLLLSLIRQESLFEGFAESTAGARGPMQIMPTTGQEIVNSMSWPANYSSADLYRPSINIPLGARYLSRQITYFNGEIYTALAAYNGGPGNATSWRDLSGSDPDLFLETIRYEETRTYLKYIYLNYHNYLALYTPAP